MLPEIAIGDAYGAAFEFAKTPPDNDLQYHDHPNRKDELYKGGYTDDTQMSIAIIRHMLDGGNNQYHIIRHFLKEFKKYPIDGYARKFQKFLEKCNTPSQFIRNISPISSRNGAAMRSVPIGVMADWEELMSYAIIQASTTHATPDGILSSQIIAGLAHYFYHPINHKCSPETWLKHKFGSAVNQCFKKPEEDIPCDALKTVYASVYLVLNYKKMTTILKKAIEFGGDTDSVASISLGLASLAKDIKNDLPEHLYSGLSPDNRRTLDELHDLENKLFESYPRVDDV